MMPTEVYNRLVFKSEVLPQMMLLHSGEIAHIETHFRGLQSLQSTDEIEGQVANSNRGDNSRLAWYSLYTAVMKTPSKEDQLNLVEWELLFARYSNECELLTTLGTLIKGMLLHNMGKLLPEASDAYHRASIEANKLPGRADLLSICHFCTAKLNADLNQIDEALRCYDKAFALAADDMPLDTDWRSLVTALRDRSVKQNNLINRLLEYQSPEQWQPELKQNLTLVDNDDFVELCKNRSRLLAAQKKYEQACLAAALADVVSVFRGMAQGFRQELAAYYLHQNLLEPAEMQLRSLLQDDARDIEIKNVLACCLLRQEKNARRVSSSLLQSLRLTPTMPVPIVFWDSIMQSRNSGT